MHAVNVLTMQAYVHVSYWIHCGEGGVEEERVYSCKIIHVSDKMYVLSLKIITFDCTCYIATCMYMCLYMN